MSVELEKKMEEPKLDSLFPVASWPSAHAVNEMATKIQRQETRKLPVTFQAVQLRKLAGGRSPRDRQGPRAHTKRIPAPCGPTMRETHRQRQLRRSSP